MLGFDALSSDALSTGNIEVVVIGQAPYSSPSPSSLNVTWYQAPTYTALPATGLNIEWPAQTLRRSIVMCI